MRSTSFIVLTGVFSLSVLSVSISSLPAQPPPPPNPTVSSDAPADVEIPAGFPATSDPTRFFDDFSWRMFIALNWPAKSDSRGAPNRTEVFGAASTKVVWGTWKADWELLQPNGARPSPWIEFAAVSPHPEAEWENAGKSKVLGGFRGTGTVIEHYNQAGLGVPTGTLVARNRTYTRYEIAMNQTQYEFIRGDNAIPATWLYLRRNLPAVGAAPLKFPTGSVEVKAAWREFKLPEEHALLPRYYTVEADLIDPVTQTGRRKTMGLVGLHIVARTATRPEWIWSTFEQVDNLSIEAGSPAELTPTYNDPAGPQVSTAGGVNVLAPIVDAAHPPQVMPVPAQVVRNKAITSSTAATNALYRGHADVRGTVWKNYQLVMTQWPTTAASGTSYPAAAGNPFPGDALTATTTSNAAMETMNFVQNTQSCMRCHFSVNKPNNTEFVWFLSLRAFPTNTPGPLAARVKLAELNAELMK